MALKNHEIVRLGEHVCSLESSIDVLDFDLSAVNVLPEVMVLAVDMFGPGSKFVLRRKYE
jgi:hypothetical protein